MQFKVRAYKSSLIQKLSSNYHKSFLMLKERIKNVKIVFAIGLS